MLLPIPPVGILYRSINYLFSWLTKFLLLDTYKISHERWFEHHRLGKHWEDCEHYFKYSLYTAMATDSEPRISKIALCAVDEDIASLTLVFEAESVSARFQEHINIINLTKKPIIFGLNHLPYQDLIEINENTGALFSWDSYKISVTSLTLKSGCEITPFQTHTKILTQTWLLNSKWSYRWNRYWNLDAIKEAKHRINQYWTFIFGELMARSYSPTGSGDTKTHQLIIMFKRSIAWIMTKEWVLEMQFWVAIWSGLYFLNDNLELQWRWSKTEITENIETI